MTENGFNAETLTVLNLKSGTKGYLTKLNVKVITEPKQNERRFLMGVERESILNLLL